MNRYGSVYVVTNTVTNEQYIGQTRQKVARRWKTHINTANSKIAIKYNLAKAILEYGADCFCVEEVFVAFTSSALNEAEVAWILELSPKYNITKGGAGHRGVVCTNEQRKERAERIKNLWARPDWRLAQIEKLKKAASSEEAKERMRKIAAAGLAARWKNHSKKAKVVKPAKPVKIKKDPLIGRMLSAKAKWIPVYCPELNCSFISQKAASEFFGVLNTSICNAVKTKGKVLRKYTLEKVA